jgi:inosose dehydratase
MNDNTITRRGFLQTSAATVAACGFAAQARAEDEKKEDPFGGFLLGIQSYTFRNFPKVEDALKRTKDLGLHYIEFYQAHAPVQATPAQIQALLKLCKEYEITPVAWGVQGFSKDHEANKRYFEFAKAMGLKSLSADPTLDSFESLDKLCEEYKIAIAIHPHGPGARWTTATQIMAAVKDHNPLIGTCLDTGHLIRMAQIGTMLNIAQEVRTMGPRNFGMHLKDHDNKRKTDVIYGRDGGVLDVLSVLRALREVKFQGTISIEYEANPNDPSADVRACVEVFKESVKKLA